MPSVASICRKAVQYYLLYPSMKNGDAMGMRDYVMWYRNVKVEAFMVRCEAATRFAFGIC